MRQCVFDSYTETIVSVIATPDEESTFEGWSGPCEGVVEAECVFVLSDESEESNLVIARFQDTNVSHLAEWLVDYAERAQMEPTQSYYDFAASVWIDSAGLEREVLNEAWIMTYGSLPSE